MTRSTMSATDSSMAPKVNGKNEPGHYPTPGWLRVAAHRLALTEGTVKQLAFGPDNAFDRVAVLVSSMIESGNRDLADRRCMPLDTARSGILVVTGEHDVVLMDACEADAAENPATLAYAMNKTPHTWSTARRRLIQEVAAKLRLIRAGDHLNAQGRE